MDPAFHWTLRIALALLLGAAAAHKLRDRARFAAVLDAYALLPAASVGVAARVVPVVEAALAAALVLGWRPALVGSAAASLMLLYGAAILVNLRRGRTDIDCGCMGPASHVPLAPALVIRNLGLAAACAAVAAPVAPRGLGALDVGGILAATVTLGACWRAAEGMLALAPRLALLRRSS